MGKTWTSEQRKKYGKRKTRNHRTRAQFKRQNPGVRLRTLEVDIRDFQDAKGNESAVPLHVTKVPASDFVADERIRKLGVCKSEKQLRKEAKRKAPVHDVPRKDTPLTVVERPSPEQKVPVNLRGIGEEKYLKFNKMTRQQLDEDVAFFKKQLRFITSMSRIFRNLGDLETAERIRNSKDDYLQGELNALLLYIQRFR